MDWEDIKCFALMAVVMFIFLVIFCFLLNEDWRNGYRNTKYIDKLLEQRKKEEKKLQDAAYWADYWEKKKQEEATP